MTILPQFAVAILLFLSHTLDVITVTRFINMIKIIIIIFIMIIFPSLLLRYCCSSHTPSMELTGSKLDAHNPQIPLESFSTTGLLIIIMITKCVMMIMMVEKSIPFYLFVQNIPFSLQQEVV